MGVGVRTAPLRVEQGERAEGPGPADGIRRGRAVLEGGLEEAYGAVDVLAAHADPALVEERGQVVPGTAEERGGTRPGLGQEPDGLLLDPDRLLVLADRVVLDLRVGRRELAQAGRELPDVCPVPGPECVGDPLQHPDRVGECLLVGPRVRDDSVREAAGGHRPLPLVTEILGRLHGDVVPGQGAKEVVAAIAVRVLQEVAAERDDGLEPQRGPDAVAQELGRHRVALDGRRGRMLGRDAAQLGH